MSFDNDKLRQETQHQTGSHNIPHFYFNGYQITIRPADVIIILKRDEETVANLYASLSTAKTITTKLSALLSLLEEKTSYDIPTIDELDEAMSKDDKNADDK